jgi:hypothetical protein
MNEWTPVIVLFNALLKGDCYLLLLVEGDGLIEPSLMSSRHRNQLIL